MKIKNKIILLKLWQCFLAIILICLIFFGISEFWKNEVFLENNKKEICNITIHETDTNFKGGIIK